MVYVGEMPGGARKDQLDQARIHIRLQIAPSSAPPSRSKRTFLSTERLPIHYRQGNSPGVTQLAQGKKIIVPATAFAHDLTHSETLNGGLDNSVHPYARSSSMSPKSHKAPVFLPGQCLHACTWTVNICYDLNRYYLLQHTEIHPVASEKKD